MLSSWVASVAEYFEAAVDRRPDADNIRAEVHEIVQLTSSAIPVTVEDETITRFMMHHWNHSINTIAELNCPFVAPDVLSFDSPALRHVLIFWQSDFKPKVWLDEWRTAGGTAVAVYRDDGIDCLFFRGPERGEPCLALPSTDEMHELLICVANDDPARARAIEAELIAEGPCWTAGWPIRVIAEDEGFGHA